MTNLNGPYPPGEYSHLYIGCLAPSLLNQTSEISFLMTYDLEYLSDAIWMEYSIDGRNWLRFGDRHAGYNWYNKAHAYDIWDDEKWIWETTSSPLTELVGLPIEHLSLRFTFETNEFVENEGVAIARLRLNNAVNTKINTSSVHLTGQSLGEGNVLLTDSSGDIYAQLDDKGQILGKIELNVHIERDHLPAYRDKFLMQRYYSLKIEAPVEQAYDLTLYLKNQEYLNYLIADHQAYSMADIGYLLYDGLNTDTSYSNNHFDLNYEFYVPDSIDFWPYMDGYELRLSMDKQSAEIYLTSNTPYEAAYPFVAITDLEVFREDSSDHTFIRWEVSKEDAVKHYIVQHSNDGKNFVDVGVVEANGLGSYSLADTVHVQNGAHYYRIATVGLDSTIISLIDSISITHQPTNIMDYQSAQWFQVSYLGSGTIEIHLNAQQYKRPVFRLIDMSGKVIDEWKNLPMEGVVQLHSTALQRSAAAVYTLQMIHDHQSQSAKLVKSD
ncbi:MAG TPA: hypothetical protein VFD65_03655 [Chitinophagales bacterium]|nr:hypothetical protein [Chitinophagales bacterium]